MELSKLEIKGFKSFGDKVTLHFDKGITGVVGPNGCGKSNIVDAIRWVLGEQKTRALRSEKMENVIFNGTKTRKPLQMAEVSLTFNNTRNLLPTEYSQVVITRRYYRSGDSEYLLNGVACRLKDITDLFLDTGIGSDSYAIIELKMVDDILNDKDNSRRTLFEEAAGISKFKIRKKQTLKKLDETDKDLERVEDILFEIEKNMKSLEKQAKQAEKYLSIKDEYKTASVELAKKNIESTRQKFAVLNKKIEEQTSIKENINAQLKTVDAEIETIKLGVLKQEQLLSSRQKTLNEYVDKIRKYENEKKVKNERSKYLKDKRESLLRSIDVDSEKIEEITTELKLIDENILDYEKIIIDQEAVMAALQKEVELEKSKAVDTQERINILNKDLRAKKDAFFEFKKSLEVNYIRLESLQKELDKADQTSGEQIATVDDTEAKLKILANRLDEENLVLNNLVQKEEENQGKIDYVSSELEVCREKLTKANREKDATENEYKLTKSLVDNLEGFPKAIKFLKKNGNWGKDAPLLSDILTCDEAYRITIENFLEPVMSFYVVEEVNHALRAINLLSESSKGKANFFVLKEFSDESSLQDRKIENCKLAISLIEYDRRYEKLLWFLFKDVYLIEEGENFPDVAGCTFLTKSGKVIKKPKSLSGGSVGLFEGARIGRVKNLEKLQSKLVKLEDLAGKLTVERDKFQNDLLRYKGYNYRKQIDSKRVEINKIDQDFTGLRVKQDQIASLLIDNKIRKEDLLQNISWLKKAIDESQPKVDIKNVEIEGETEKITKLEAELESQNVVLSEKSKLFNEKNIQFHQNKNKLESFVQEQNYKSKNVGESQERLLQHHSNLKLTEEEIQKMMADDTDSDEHLISMYKEKEDIEKGVQEAEKTYYQSRSKVESVEKDVKEKQRVKTIADEELLTLNNEHNEAKLSISSVKERLKVEFNVNLDQLLLSQDDEVEELRSKDELKNLVEDLRSKISKIGPINPMALEAYDEIKKRFDFIAEQKNDLVDSKKSLMSTISEIDTVAKTSFLEAFNKIRDNFLIVFRSLFTEEDTCDLKLADESNPLDSAIDIMAKPKGKRPLSINQLSGGEKTLTAVALLFSIYLIKPAPFCIFDEVDAPLDDANIDKFNKIIRKFSADSQFILVTHNKRTMATTDVMYGVTMLESGVSRLVPVDLKDLNDSVAE